MSDASEWDFPNSATQPGSAAYYVVRFSLPEQQHALARWFAWFDHIDRIAAKANDPGVARLKLDWWREEAQKMLDDQARHPIAEALSPQVQKSTQVEQMHLALNAIEQRILRRQPQSLDELHNQCEEQYGSRLMLLCGCSDALPQASINKLGRHIAITRRLAELAQDLRDHYISLPADMLATTRLEAEELEKPSQSQALADLGNQLIESVGDIQLGMLADNQATLPATRYAAQSVRLARLLRKRGYATNRRHQLTPIGLLWSAWRAR